MSSSSTGIVKFDADLWPTYLRDRAALRAASFEQIEEIIDIMSWKRGLPLRFVGIMQAVIQRRMDHVASDDEYDQWQDLLANFKQTFSYQVRLLQSDRGL